MSKKILITGGTGFVGSNLINSLINNYDCINLGRSENNLCKNIQWNFKDRLDDLINYNIDTVIHCASIVGNQNIIKSDYIDVNVKSTLELLEFASRNGVKKFIYISTGGVYGYKKKEFSESDECSPTDIYGLSKYFAEQLCSSYKKEFPIIILRLFFPYGIGQKNRLIANLINYILEDKEIVFNKNGLPIINPIHINDVVNILEKMLETNCNGIFNVCGNENISVEQLSEKIALSCNKNTFKFVYGDNHVSNVIGSNEKICKLLNYTMENNLDKGIKSIVNSIS